MIKLNRCKRLVKSDFILFCWWTRDNKTFTANTHRLWCRSGVDAISNKPLWHSAESPRCVPEMNRALKGAGGRVIAGVRR